MIIKVLKVAALGTFFSFSLVNCNGGNKSHDASSIQSKERSLTVHEIDSALEHANVRQDKHLAVLDGVEEKISNGSIFTSDVVAELSKSQASSTEALGVVDYLDEVPFLNSSNEDGTFTYQISTYQCIEGCRKEWHKAWNACHNAGTNPQWPNTVPCSDAAFRNKRICENNCRR